MLKKFLIGTFALALMLSVGVLSVDAFSGATLKVGSRGADVMELQTLVGATPVDGVFGPMTKAKVMAWQASNGLVADGVFGPMSMAKANAGSTGGTYPAGCTSNTGFSSTTGQSCAVSTTLPAGCTSTVGFSPTTGAKCDGGSTPGTTGPLVGGAGDLKISETAVDTESEVAEGKTEKVLAFRAEAQDSDIQINSLKVYLENTDAPNTNRLPSRYLSTIEILMGSTKVGSISASDLTRDTENVYSRSISLNNAIVREGLANRETFYVVFKALSNIDSLDMADAEFDLSVDNIRFTDATGVIMTSNDDASVSGITFTDPASSGDVRMRVSLDSNSPAEGSVQVNEFSTTSNVDLLSFKLKAESVDMNVETIYLKIDSTGDNLDDILADLKLMKGSSTIADYSGSFDADGSQVVKFELYDDLLIEEGDTVTLKLVAKLLKQDGNFDSGATLTASLTSPSSNIVAEDEDGNSISNFTGSASGYTQTLFVNGANISFVSSTSTQVDNDGKVRDFVLVFDVTAIGDDLTVDRTNVDSSSTDGVQYAISGANATGSASLSSTASLNGNIYTVSEGQTKRFTLTVTVTTTTTGQKKIVLEKVGGVSTTSVVESVSATVITSA